MSKKITTLALAPISPDQLSYRQTKALELKRRGWTIDAIAEELHLESSWDAAQLVSQALTATMSETIDQMRAASEDRILDVIRRVNDDIAITPQGPIRVQLYKVLLSADAQLSRLWGLAIPEGLPDQERDA